VSIYDTYRVVVTRADGKQIPTSLRTRDDALEYFTGVLARKPLKPGYGLRVISEQTWLAAKAAKR
jgi:hypothetical protein